MPVITDDRSATRRRLIWSAAGTLAIVLLAWRLALGLTFVGDDFIILHLVRHAGGLQHPGAFFRLDLFAYYRPIAFLSQALDWHIWHEQPFGYHLTSLLLHAVNALLVFTIAHRLIDRTAAVIAALLFALHPSNHEAVFWIAARFDLLATAFMLAGLLTVIAPAGRRPDGSDNGRRAGGPLAWSATAACFALALLSKESAFALPLVVAAHDTFVARRSGRATLLRLVPLLAIMAVYAAVRFRLPAEDAGPAAPFAKALLLACTLGAVIGISFAGTDRVRSVLARRQPLMVAVLSLVLALVFVAALLPSSSAFVRPKLAFVTFATFYLVSPVITLGATPPLEFDPNSAACWVAGWASLAAATLLLVIAGRRSALRGPASNGLLAFLFVFVAAALIPVSSMTEGKRYLYLASAGVSLLAAYGITRLSSRARSAAIAAVVVVLAVSAWQIDLKARDWAWAGSVTGEATRLVRARAADPCRAPNVLLVTAPVNIRDVYCNLYDYTFEDPATGCLPAQVRAVVRVVGRDRAVSMRWTEPATLAFETDAGDDRLVASSDLRRFDVPLSPGRALDLPLPIGLLSVRPTGPSLRLTLRLADAAEASRWHLLYYDSGHVREVPVPR